MSNPECGSYFIEISSSGYGGTLYCNTDAVCAINTQVGLWDCVTTAASLPVSQTGLVGFASFNLACVDNSDLNTNCDEACALFTSRTTCSDPMFPSCATFVLFTGYSYYSRFYCAEATIAINVDEEDQQFYQFDMTGPQSVPGYAIPMPTSSPAAAPTSSISPASPASAIPSTTVSNTAFQQHSTVSASSNAGQPLAYSPYTPGVTPTQSTSSSNSVSTSLTTQIQTPTSSGPSLSTGAAAGIGAGVSVAGLAGLAFLLFWFYRRRQKTRESAREAKERNHRYTVESNNGEYFGSPDVKSTASAYLDHPYTPQMNMQEMGSPKDKELIPVSPNSEVSGKTQMRLSTVSGITGVSALPSPSEVSGVGERSELSSDTGNHGAGLGIAELDAAVQR